MKPTAYVLLLLAITLFCFTSCSKKEVSPPPVVITPPLPPPPPPPTVPSFSVDGKWECLVDGLPYSGIIDTSFVVLSQSTPSNPDTILWCTGTSIDKKANIFSRSISIVNRMELQYTTRNLAANLPLILLGAVSFKPLLIAAPLI